MIDFSIITECYIDTNLIETIAPTKIGYNHQKGSGTVTYLMQNKFKDKFSVGIVDKDKKELKYAQSFNEIINIENLLLYRHKNNEVHHYLIFIKPAIESWIIENAKSANIKLKNFDLTDNIDDLTKRSKKITSKNDKNFKNLFKEFQKQQVKKVIILSEWIKYLKDKNYNARVDDLINLTRSYFDEEEFI